MNGQEIFLSSSKAAQKKRRILGFENPHEIVETNNRNDLKVMMFVAIVNGKIPIVHAFIDEDGRLVSVNGSCYLNLLKEVVWPSFCSSANQKGLWWMQDGAPAHCTTDAKEFVLEKLVISRGTDIARPAHSPDINPLDFYFWASAQRQVYASKPSTIDELIDIVKQYAVRMF